MIHRLRPLSPLVLAFFVYPIPAQWHELTLPVTPGQLSAPAMATGSNAVLLFGGSDGAFTFTYTNATWRFDGSWTQLSPPTQPSERHDARMVFDLVRGVHVLYGGANQQTMSGLALDDTWQFDGVQWNQVTTATTPGGRWHHAMCFDLLRNVTVMFGGRADPLSGSQNETWEFDGTNWTEITTNGAPPPLDDAAMCFDIGLGRCVLFGGGDPFAGTSDQLWLYDGSAWTSVPQAATWPAARTGAELVYDPVRGVCLLSGGVSPLGNVFVDTWLFDGSSLTWTQLPTIGPATAGFALAYEPIGRSVVRYGGSGIAGRTWLHGASERVFGAGCPGSNGTPSLAAASPPRLGSNHQLQLQGLVPSATTAVLVLSLTATAPVPLDGIGMTGCEAHVTPDLLVALAASAGTATFTTAIPAASGLLGTSLFAQGLSVDPMFNPAWLTASNAHEGVLGL